MVKRYRATIRRLVIAAFLVAATGVQASDDRAETLGQGLICMCSCGQLLSGCEMINCPSVHPMRRELQGYIDEGKDDKTILALFADKYGPKVLSAPPAEGWFNISAWVMPFAMLAAGGLAVILFLRHLKSKAAVTEAPPVDVSKYENEIEEELRRLTPED